MPEEAIPCLVCARELLNMFPDLVENQPAGGLSFSTPGQYGSNAFDPMDGSRLVVNVCDDCIQEASTDGRVMISDHGPHPMSFWLNPPDDIPD